MKTKKVIVLPYDNQWRYDFEKIASEVRATLGEAAISIEHVGSTSVEGLSAKPIIDIDVVIESMDSFSDARSRLEKAGYCHEGNLGIEGREAFKYTGKEHLRKHHLYVCPKDSEELKRHLAFRNYLRENRAAAEEYGRIKKEGAKLYPEDIDGYIRHKSAFIEKIYRECGIHTLNVRSLEAREVCEAAEFSWQISAKKKYRSYPLVQSAEEMRELYEKSLGDEEGGTLGCWSDGVMRGAACWYSIREDRYLQTTGLYGEDGETIGAMIDALEGRYPGYEAYIGITRENENADVELVRRGYRLIDDCIDLRLVRENAAESMRAPDLCRADKAMKERYLQFHERCFNEGYWNRERMDADCDNWDIYAVLEKEEIAGALFAKNYGNGTGEVFGMEAKEKDARRLMRYAVCDMYERYDGLDEIVFMADAAEEMQAEAALEAGFEEKSTYRCWMRKIER